MRHLIRAAVRALTVAAAAACTAAPAANPASAHSGGGGTADVAAGNSADAAPLPTGDVKLGDAAADASPGDAAQADIAADTGAPDATAADGSPDVTADPGPTPDGVVDVASGDAKPTDAGAADASSADTAGDVSQPVDAPSSDAKPGGAVVCAGPGAYAFPALSKTCKADADCFVALHQVNCCGTMVALGLAVADKAAFDAAEKVCGGQYPGCGCASMGTMAEDGHTDTTGAGIAVNCKGGLCATSVKAAAAKCGPNGAESPKPFKWCAVSSDCAFVLRQVDCCGSQMAVGIAASAKDAFAAFDAKCTAAGPICDCLAKPTAAEDGGEVGPNGPTVACTWGSCLTGSK